MGNFLNTAVGSYVKAFIAIVLTLVLVQLQNGVSFLALDWTVLGNGALMAFLPVVINLLNPKDERYGLTSKKEK